jgi:hypothetical protein
MYSHVCHVWEEGSRGLGDGFIRKMQACMGMSGVAVVFVDHKDVTAMNGPTPPDG